MTLNGIKKKLSPPNYINEIWAKTTKIVCSERSTTRHREGGRREIPTNPRVKVSYIKSVTFIADPSTAAVTGHRSWCRLSVRQVCRALVRDKRCALYMKANYVFLERPCN
jgi:hypothetical protein